MRPHRLSRIDRLRGLAPQNTLIFRFGIALRPLPALGLFLRGPFAGTFTRLETRRKP
jgi:hypothetical protein